MCGPVRVGKRGLTLAVHVVPRAAKSQIVGLQGQAVQVHLHAPPVAGAANAELVAVVAEALGLARRQVVVVSGAKGRRKVLHVSGRTPQELQSWVQSLPQKGV